MEHAVTIFCIHLCRFHLASKCKYNL